MSLWVKICGVRTVEEALHAWRSGADALGLNLAPPSPRALTLGEATALAQTVRAAARAAGRPPPELLAVLVSPTAEALRAVESSLAPDRVQVHGDERAARALGLPRLPVYRADPGVLDALGPAPGRFLLDASVPGAHGGTGRRVDEGLARAAAARGELVLAGGLRADNVAGVVARVRPWGVDVASGVERAPGVKDPDAVAEFIHRARAAAAR